MLSLKSNLSCISKRLFSSFTAQFNQANTKQNIIYKSLKTSRSITSPKLRRSSIQNTQTPTSRSSPIIDQLQDKIQPVTTYTTCENYDLEDILRHQNQHGMITSLIANEILHFKFQDAYDVLILESGTIVAWGLDESGVAEKILPLFKESMLGKYDFPESEDLDYIPVQDRETDTIGEVIIVNETNAEQALLDKAAFSSGLSRSTRLAILENALERHIQKTRKLTEGLSIGSKISITEHELLRLTGRLFLIRGKLNLYSELIEIPDLYWSEPHLERIYKKASNILDISPRISILNKKLDYATDESRALMGTLNEKKSTRLEWVIIWLILIEVCFETFHFYEKYWVKEDDHKNPKSQ